MLLYLQMLETPEEKSLFEQIYLEYRGLMYHVAYEILHNDQDAEDAVHQAFVKIVENIKKIDDPVCPKTHGYVVTIVEHQAIDQYRRLQKHPSVELIEEIQGTNAHYEGDNDLTKCILKLPARYREMILLRYHHGYTVREIAKVLGLSLPTAIKLDQRAKSRLKKSEEGRKELLKKAQKAGIKVSAKEVDKEIEETKVLSDELGEKILQVADEVRDRAATK